MIAVNALDTDVAPGAHTYQLQAKTDVSKLRVKSASGLTAVVY